MLAGLPSLMPAPMIGAPPCTTALYLGPAAIDPPILRRPQSGFRVQLGFPSPAEDFVDGSIDLNELLVRNAPATFYYRADGSSMLLAGIRDGDVLVVDRSVSPRDGDLVLATWDGNQPVCKILKLFAQHMELHSAHPDHPPIVLESSTDVEVFAITGVARQISRKRPHVRAG